MQKYTVLSIAALLLLACPTTTSAADGERALSLFMGYATYSVDERQPHGATVGADYVRGLSEAVSWRLSGAIGGYRGDGINTASGHLSLGLVYLLDVLKYVPYISAAIGGAAIDGPDVKLELQPLAELGAGLDILHSRSLSYGAYARLSTLLDRSTMVTVDVRVTWRWGFF